MVLELQSENNIVLSKLNELMKQTGRNDPFCFTFSTGDFFRDDYLDKLTDNVDIFPECKNELREIFELIGRSLHKSRYIQGEIDMLPKGVFTTDFSKFDEMLEKISGKESARKFLSAVDMEKIEGLESIFRAMEILESIASSLTLEVFLWLEHHLQRLKVLFIVVRQLTEICLISRFIRQADSQFSFVTLRAKCKDLRITVRQHRIILDEFEITKVLDFVDIVEQDVVKE